MLTPLKLRAQDGAKTGHDEGQDGPRWTKMGSVGRDCRWRVWLGNVAFCFWRPRRDGRGRIWSERLVTIVRFPDVQLVVWLPAVAWPPAAQWRNCRIAIDPHPRLGCAPYFDLVFFCVFFLFRPIVSFFAVFPTWFPFFLQF